MNADGQPGIDMRADLGVRMPARRWIDGGLLAAGAVIALAGGLPITGAIRHRAGRARTA